MKQKNKQDVKEWKEYHLRNPILNYIIKTSDEIDLIEINNCCKNVLINCLLQVGLQTKGVILK